MRKTSTTIHQQQIDMEDSLLDTEIRELSDPKCLKKYRQWRQKKYHLALEELYSALGDEIEKSWDALLGLSSSVVSKRLVLQTVQVLELLRLSQTRSCYRRQHTRFLSAFRKALNILEGLQDSDCEEVKLCSGVLLNLAAARFMGVHCYTFGIELIRKVILSGYINKKGEKNVSLQQLNDLSFQEECQLIDAADQCFKAPFLFIWFRKLFGRLNTCFDPHQYNHPFVLYMIDFKQMNGDIKEVAVLRMGTPTKENYLGSRAKIIPEFKAFLHYLKQANKSHLYINKQQLYGLEAPRSQALKDLSVKEDHFYLVCLPSDGKFYEQNYDIKSKKAFKHHILDVLKHDCQNFYFPKPWLEDSFFCKQLELLLDEVDECFFGNKEELSILDRQNFIEHYYTLLELFLIHYAGVDSVNITCKDGIDRAAKEHSKLLTYCMAARGLNENKKQDLWFIHHVPAFFVKKRAIVLSRRLRLKRALLSYTDTVKQRIIAKHQSNPLVMSCPRFIKRTEQPITFGIKQ